MNEVGCWHDIRIALSSVGHSACRWLFLRSTSRFNRPPSNRRSEKPSMTTIHTAVLAPDIDLHVAAPLGNRAGKSLRHKRGCAGVHIHFRGPVRRADATQIGTETAAHGDGEWKYDNSK